MEYETFRQFADSWGLVYLLSVFVLVVLYAFRPGSRKVARDVAMIPFREDRDV